MKTILDKKYETPSIITKALLYVNYLCRINYWRITDFFAQRKTQTSKFFDLNSNFNVEFKENGFLHLHNVFPEECIDKIVSSIQTSRKTLEKGRKPLGLHSGRIANLHAINKEVLNFLNDPVIQKIQRKLLNSEPILWGSLIFNKGSQQSLHADAPFFYVEPYGAMIGMWIALEDINPDAGPLCYIPQSHKKTISVESAILDNLKLREEVDAFRELSVSASPRKFWDLSFAVSEEYSKKYASLEGAVQVCPKKGDVFFWHQWLVHGGSKINNGYLSRNSIVSHWVGDNSVAFDQHNFFLNYGKLDEKIKQILPINRFKNGKHIRQYKCQILNWD